MSIMSSCCAGCCRWAVVKEEVVQYTHIVNDLLQGINYEQSICHCYAQGSDYRTFNEI